jgi:excisionase family DNA binding protein
LTSSLSPVSFLTMKTATQDTAGFEVPVAAKAVPVGPRTLLRMIAAGHVRATRLVPRGRWRIPVSEVERLRAILAGTKP